MASVNSRLIIKTSALFLLGIALVSLSEYKTHAEGAQIARYKRSARAENLFSIVKQASSNGIDYARELVSSLPFSKILLTGGALVSLFFIFMRLLIVLGPILILGALTRESSEATDILRTMVDFYNNIIVALDEQANRQIQPNSPTMIENLR